MSRPVVGVYRKTWKGWDLTFIQNQVGSYSRWKPFRMVHSKRKRDTSILMDYQLPKPKTWDKKISRFVPLHWYARTFLRDLKKNNVKVIHVHFGTDAFGLLPYLRLHRIPLVVTFHGFDVTKDVDGDTAVCQRNRQRLTAVFQRASLLIAVSTFIAERLKALGAPEEKIRVHYMGIPHREMPSLRPKKDILFVGRFVEKKGIDDLIRAYALLPESIRAQHRLLLVGSGAQEAALKQLASDLAVTPEWLGWRPIAEVYDLMADAAVFCGPSKKAVHGDSEGLGMVFLEAQSQGTPVVSTRSGGVPDAVIEGTTALLVDEADEKQLAHALETILANPGRAETMGQAGARFVRERFDVGRQTGVLEDLYDEMLRSPRKRWRWW